MQFDYVVFTGDLPAHNVWNQSRSDILGAMETVTQLFLTYLPNKKVYNTLGNHESAPVNRYDKTDVKFHNPLDWVSGPYTTSYNKIN